MDKSAILRSLAAIKNSLCFKDTILGQIKIAELELALKNMPVEKPVKNKSKSYGEQAIYYRNLNIALRQESYNKTLNTLRDAVTHAERLAIVAEFKPMRLSTTEAERAKWQCVKDNYPEVISGLSFIRLYKNKRGE